MEKLRACSSPPGLGSGEVLGPATFQATAVTHSRGQRLACTALFSQRHPGGHGLERRGSAAKQGNGKTPWTVKKVNEKHTEWKVENNRWEPISKTDAGTLLELSGWPRSAFLSQASACTLTLPCLGFWQGACLPDAGYDSPSLGCAVFVASKFIPLTSTKMLPPALGLEPLTAGAAPMMPDCSLEEHGHHFWFSRKSRHKGYFHREKTEAMGIKCLSLGAGIWSRRGGTGSADSLLLFP